MAYDAYEREFMAIVNKSTPDELKAHIRSLVDSKIFYRQHYTDSIIKGKLTNATANSFNSHPGPNRQPPARTIDARPKRRSKGAGD